MTRLVSRWPEGSDHVPRSRRSAHHLLALTATMLAAACGASHGGTANRASQAPAPATAATPQYAPGAGSGFAASGTGVSNDQSLWTPGQAACPAGPTSGANATGSASQSTGSRSAATTSGSGAGSDSAARRPAIVLRASARAQEVRFASQPRIVVRLCGGTLDSVHVIERRNLPSPVVAGTTYRDVYVAVEILGHLDAACIVSKLGASNAQTPGPCASLTLSDSAGARRTTTPSPTNP